MNELSIISESLGALQHLAKKDTIFLDDLLVDIENDGGTTLIFPNENDTIIQTRDEIKEIICD